jgi:ribonuclease-3
VHGNKTASKKKGVISRLQRIFRFSRADRDGSEELQRRIGYSFRRAELLRKALSHRSYLSTPDGCNNRSNERLEFLGDAVLGVVVSEHLFQLHPKGTEGELTKLKAALVNRRALYHVACELDLGAYIMLSPEEVRAGGRLRASILADAYEALVGAVFLDGKLDAARAVVEGTLLSRASSISRIDSSVNYKGALLEHAQGGNRPTPVYKVLDRTGPDHDLVFTVTVSINGKEIGRGKGRTKKTAEQRAAAEALVQLGIRPQAAD